MPLPFIIGAAVAIATGYGAKKGFDGYQSHSEADDIIDRAKSLYNDKKSIFDGQEKSTHNALEQLGKLELDIGAKFADFSTIADELLTQINQGRQNKLKIKLPKHQLEKIENYTFTTIGVLGSAAGAGAAGAAAGFAIYGGVMTFAAASTGTAISALSGVAATNATLAAIGGGALSAGGLGMAGGTAILGAAVAAPVLAIAGWVYANHGEEALSNARKARDEVEKTIEKLTKAVHSLQKVEHYADKARVALYDIYNVFKKYLDKLQAMDQFIKSAAQLNQNADQYLQSMSSDLMQTIENGYALAAILTDIITTPLFKLKVVGGQPVQNKDGVPEMEKDSDGSIILNAEAVAQAINLGVKLFGDFKQA